MLGLNDHYRYIDIAEDVFFSEVVKGGGRMVNDMALDGKPWTSHSLWKLSFINTSPSTPPQSTSPLPSFCVDDDKAMGTTRWVQLTFGKNATCNTVIVTIGQTSTFAVSRDISRYFP